MKRVKIHIPKKELQKAWDEMNAKVMWGEGQAIPGISTHALMRELSIGIDLANERNVKVSEKTGLIMRFSAFAVRHATWEPFHAISLN